MKKRIFKILCIVFLFGGGILITLHIYLLDGLDGWFFSTGFVEDTFYAPGYSDKAFRKVKRGVKKQVVLSLLGTPLGESWYYHNIGDHKEVRVWFSNDYVTNIHTYDNEELVSVHAGMKKENVLDVLGAPIEESWVYTKSPKDKSYRIRVIIFKNDNVTEKIHEFYVD